MTEQKKSRKSRSSRDVARILLALVPLPLALSLCAFPEFGELQVLPLLLVFILGTLIGTIGHVYWIRVLLREREFYKDFYEKSVLKPHRVEVEMQKRHTKNLIPFYVFGTLVFFLVLFIFGIFQIGFPYLLPLIFGAMEGQPLSYLLIERGIISA